LRQLLTDFKTVTLDHSDTPPALCVTQRRSPQNSHAQLRTPIIRRSLVDGFLLDCKVTGKSLATIQYYTQKLGKFLWYADRFRLPDDISEITPQHIRQFLAYARTTDRERWGSRVANANRPISPATIKRYYSCLRAMFNWAVNEGLIDYSPLTSIKPPREPHHVVKALTADQVTKLLSTFNGRSYLSIRNKAIVSVMIDTAIRLGELLNLTVTCADLERQILLSISEMGHFLNRTLWHDQVALTRSLRFRL